MSGLSAESAARMVFTTDEIQKWAVSMMTVPGETSPRSPLPAPPPLGNEWIYFIQAGPGGAVKIGYSRDPWTRFQGIQTGSPIDHIYLGNMPGNRRMEHELHIRFDRIRVRGEWFQPTEELLMFIDTHRLRREDRWRPGADFFIEEVDPPRGPDALTLF